MENRATYTAWSTTVWSALTLSGAPQISSDALTEALRPLLPELAKNVADVLANRLRE